MKSALLLVIFIITLSINSYAQQCIAGDCLNGFGTFIWVENQNRDTMTYIGSWQDGSMHGSGTFYFVDGGFYTGEFFNNKRHGFGIYTWPSGQKFTGEWRDDYQHGNGTLQDVDGSVVYGRWENGQYVNQTLNKTTGCISGNCQNEFGVYVWSSGEKYEGYWLGGKRNGMGTNYYANGDVYSGIWLDDQQHESGTINYATGNMFTGEYKYHKIDGKGTFSYKDGRKYIGDFKNNFQHGYGVMYYPDGRVESGNWAHDVFVGEVNIKGADNNTGCISGVCTNGYGVYLWPNGERYEGYWEKNLRNGQGTNFYGNGDKCTGNFKNDMVHGWATYTYKNGDIYKGQFFENKMTGYGIYMYVSTDRYEGFWLENKYNGEGTFYGRDGSVVAGIWEGGVYKSENDSDYGCVSGICSDGFGTYVFQNGGKYVGNFKNNTYHGKGEFLFQNGDKYIGNFEIGKMSGYGTYLFANDGKKYVGYWRNNKYDGIGTLHMPNGESVMGKWKAGDLVEKSDLQSDKPSISWIYPEEKNIQLSDQEMQIQLNIKSKQKINEVIIYINGNPVKVTNSRSFTANMPENGTTINQNIKLNSGRNIVKLTTIADNVISESDERIIIVDNFQKANRIALVIGNSAYKNAPLRNPVNDANAMATALGEAGFEVMLFTNLGLNEMKRQIRAFGERLNATKGVGLMYFAGHGIQVDGENYLIPVDAMIEKEQDVEMEAVNMKRITGEMDFAHNNLNIIILDACRNNPFARSFRSGTSSGLASAHAQQGTFIAYATAPGSVASDGDADNGLYTAELLKTMKIPKLKIEDMFKIVRKSVYEKSNKQQIPWENSSIFDDFYFTE